MADLTATLGANSRKVLTTSDQTGPETTWLVIENNDGNFETGTDYDAELTTANSTNFKVLQSIGMRCEIYEVVRPSSSLMSIKVRASSVPYAEGESRNDQGSNSILTTELRAALDDTSYTVWNGAFADDDINWD